MIALLGFLLLISLSSSLDHYFAYVSYSGNSCDEDWLTAAVWIDADDACHPWPLPKLEAGYAKGVCDSKSKELKGSWHFSSKCEGPGLPLPRYKYDECNRFVNVSSQLVCDFELPKPTDSYALVNIYSYGKKDCSGPPFSTYFRTNKCLDTNEEGSAYGSMAERVRTPPWTNPQFQYL